MSQQNIKYSHHYEEFMGLVINGGLTNSQAARRIVDKYSIDANPESVRKSFIKKTKSLQRRSDAARPTDPVVITAPGLPSNIETVQGNTYQWNEAGSVADLNFRTSAPIKTLDDALAEANVDLNIWEVANWRFNIWEGPAGAEGGNPIQYYQVRISFKRKAAGDIDYVKAVQELLPQISKQAPSFSPANYVFDNKKPNALVEFCAFDLHYGKLCWAPESGENFDSNIARERMAAAVKSSMAATTPLYNVEKILFIVGNDYFNSDNAKQTTHGGTPQTDDHRWQKVFHGGVTLLIDTIDYLMQFAPVEVMVIQGNHDWERIFYAGTVLEARYSGCQNVNVDNIPTPRKYFQYGRNLIGFTHGNNEKVNDLPMIMAQEVPQAWATSKYREFHLGHLHHNEVKSWISEKDYIGVKVRRMRSLTSNDAWHNMKGYVGQIQSAETYVWDANLGLLGIHYHNV